MARRRGFFAEMQHQSQIAARQADQRQRAAVAAQGRAERAQAAAVRAQLASQRASEADRKRLEREAAAAHVEAMQADVEQKNAALEDEWEQLENLLAATLPIDDYVDLETLRMTVEHPPFDRIDLKVPLTPPTPVPDPVEPALGQVEQPKGLFGRKHKLEEAQAKANSDFAAAHESWAARMAELPAERAKAQSDYEAAEQTRKTSLAEEEARYAAECSQREKEVADQNATLDQFIADLGYGTVEAVREYVGIVLANSVYPDHFLVEHDADFDPTTAELKVQVLVPGPTELSAIKSYKYVRATDEIASSALSLKESKDRYASVVHQIALRTLHEIFEADRRNLIQSISLELGTNTLSPATGKDLYVPFVAVGSARDKFSEIDLSAVVPSATLGHLGAAVSKSPFDLIPASGAGVRHS
jgi:restriction system protein